MTIPFDCPPAFLPWLTGSLWGLLTGLGIGFWVRGYEIIGGPWEHSQTPPHGESGGSL